MRSPPHDLDRHLPHRRGLGAAEDGAVRAGSGRLCAGAGGARDARDRDHLAGCGGGVALEKRRPRETLGSLEATCSANTRPTPGRHPTPHIRKSRIATSLAHHPDPRPHWRGLPYFWARSVSHLAATAPIVLRSRRASVASARFTASGTRNAIGSSGSRLSTGGSVPAARRAS